MARNALYAQSGGVTPVINASAAAVIAAARAHPDQIGRLFAAKNGVLGVLAEELIDTAEMSEADLVALAASPGGAFGSCRHKLRFGRELTRLFEVFAAHDIGYLFYNGCGDSADTCMKIAAHAEYLGYDLTAIHVPKTIDNDLPHSDCSPGFGSVAKYIGTSVREAAMDVASMSGSSTKVFILEVMGRHTGWIAASSGLASGTGNLPPHLILLPEVTFNAATFLAAVETTIAREGYCVIVAAEGITNAEGTFVAETGGTDAFGHAQLGGVAPYLAQLIKTAQGHKCHWAVADYLQRAARHLASKTDLDQAMAVGTAAVNFALAGERGVMPTIVRTSDAPYTWTIGSVKLEEVANHEKKLPAEYIRADGFHITPAARTYFAPLIMGEAPPPFVDGLPAYPVWNFSLVKAKLEAFNTGA